MDSVLLYILLALGKSGSPQPTCDFMLKTGLSRAAVEETRESGYILQDMGDGTCKINFLGYGEKDSIKKDPEKVRAILADKSAVRSYNVHTHLLRNVDYFSEGVPYHGEIMFADASMIDAHRLPPKTFEKRLREVTVGKYAGFNLSPPSLQDMLVAAVSPGETFVVITSGGYWTYSLADGADSSKLSDKLYDLSSYAQIFEAASQGNQRAKQLKTAILKDPEWSALIKDWQECSLELRAPTTSKGPYIRRWVALMKSLGLQMKFTAY